MGISIVLSCPNSFSRFVPLVICRGFPLPKPLPPEYRSDEILVLMPVVPAARTKQNETDSKNAIFTVSPQAHQKGKLF